MEKEFDKFFMDNQNLLFRIVNSYVKDREIAKDIVVETMYIVYEKWEKVIKMNNAIAYAVRVAINKAKRVLLSNKVKSIFFSNIENDIESTIKIEDDAIDREKAEWLNKAINELNEGERNVILLREMEMLKFEEIADILSLNISTVKTLYRRGKLKILKRWEEENEKFKM
ncbi:MAG: RNA polymerase sigma factor [Brevinematia bacterium]